ncbi:hypothetical protein [Methanosarcina sp. UBA411]|nr:hypothetical protein [Methanosarcina sp. UBA411]
MLNILKQLRPITYILVPGQLNLNRWVATAGPVYHADRVRG